jgi:hypothetical protein
MRAGKGDGLEGGGIDLQKGGESMPEGAPGRSPMGSMPHEDIGASRKKGNIATVAVGHRVFSHTRGRRL